VVLGPQNHRFTAKGIETFLSAEYAATSAMNRMGIKLEGPAIEAADGYDIITDGIATGCIQVPANGKPILLLPDHQTTGGYTKIATVITADLYKMGQIFPGNRVRFVQITPRGARRAARDYYRAIERERKRCGV
jgi:allophanate hydrolase subunit 2